MGIFQWTMGWYSGLTKHLLNLRLVDWFTNPAPSRLFSLETLKGCIVDHPKPKGVDGSLDKG